MTNHPFDLKGIDTSKVGGNKFVDYRLDQYLKDQNLKTTPRARDAALKELGLDKDYLQTVPSQSIFGKIDNFLGNFTGKTRPQDYYLPTSITERLAEADRVKTEKENFDPYGNLDKLLDYELQYKKATDEMDRKGKAADVAMEYAAMRSQLPFYLDVQKDLSTFKQDQLNKAKLIQQGFPDAVQNRLGESAIATANLRNSIANQGDTAARMAGVGLQRRFGQLT
tara:strand:+ start:124 stop:795 length:672 start_codon:yes stop_codon:yes gene_type:complete